jgi:ribose-phosphate pyrophosphokinase
LDILLLRHIFAYKIRKMKKIDLNKLENVRFILFPDNQPHVIVDNIKEDDEVQVICSLTDSLKVMHLLQTANALDHLQAKKKELVIPYLMAARYDRLMQGGDSFDLEVVANLINSCGFEKVLLFDVHSEVATKLIKHSVNINNRQLVEQYLEPDAVVICPDAGASKKVNAYLDWNEHLKDIVYCTKKRELSTGRLTLEVTDPQHCAGRNCVIIDDICDGGATFLAIAEQVKPKHLTLIVTHGIFSKGFAALEKKFNEIIVSDSYGRTYDCSILKMITAKITD